MERNTESNLGFIFVNDHLQLGALCCFGLVGQGNIFLIMHWHIFGETSMLDIGRGIL